MAETVLAFFFVFFFWRLESVGFFGVLRFLGFEVFGVLESKQEVGGESMERLKFGVLGWCFKTGLIGTKFLGSVA